MSHSKIDQILEFYTHLTSHIVPGPNNFSYVVPFILLILALCIPPSTLSHKQLYSVFLPLIYAFQIQSWWQMHGIDVISVSLTFWSFVLLVCWDPRRDFRRIHLWESPEELEDPNARKSSESKEPSSGSTDAQNGGPREKHTDNTSKDLMSSEPGSPPATIIPTRYYEEPYPTALLDRLIWVLTLLPSLRLPSWLINIPSHDADQPPPIIKRRTFLRHALFAILEGYLILDITSLYTAHDPYFHLSNTSVSSPFPPLTESTPRLLATIWSLSVPPRLLRTSILAAQIYALIPRLFFLPALPLLLPFPPLLLNTLHLIPSTWSPQTWVSQPPSINPHQKHLLPRTQPSSPKQ